MSEFQITFRSKRSLSVSREIFQSSYKGVSLYQLEWKFQHCDCSRLLEHCWFPGRFNYFSLPIGQCFEIQRYGIWFSGRLSMISHSELGNSRCDLFSIQISKISHSELTNSRCDLFSVQISLDVTVLSLPISSLSAS
jgi:hypothetical protein